MSCIYSSSSYQITFFVEEEKAKILQDFILSCSKQNYAYAVTPYGLTSVKVKSSKRKELLDLFRNFFPKERLQETLIVYEGTKNAQSLPYNDTFEIDLRQFTISNQSIDLSTVSPYEVLYFLELDSEMTWSFISGVMSLPKDFGRIVFAQGQIIFCLKVDTYFENIAEITHYLGRNGYFQYLYKDVNGNLIVSKAYFEETEVELSQPLSKEDIPRPSNYIKVKPMWYDCKY